MNDEQYAPLCRNVLHKGVIVYNAIFGHRMDMISAHIPRGCVYGGIDLPMGEPSVHRTLGYTSLRTGAALSNPLAHLNKKIHPQGGFQSVEKVQL